MRLSASRACSPFSASGRSCSALVSMPMSEQCQGEPGAHRCQAAVPPVQGLNVHRGEVHRGELPAADRVNLPDRESGALFGVG
jgi:hypothetical protein